MVPSIGSLSASGRNQGIDKVQRSLMTREVLQRIKNEEMSAVMSTSKFLNSHSPLKAAGGNFNTDRKLSLTTS